MHTRAKTRGGGGGQLSAASTAWSRRARPARRPRRGRPGGVSARLGVGSRLELRLDIGREQYTWMDPRWGASGARVSLGVALRLAEGSRVELLCAGAFSPVEFVEGGTWALDEARLRLELPHAGLRRQDLALDEPLRLAVPLVGGAPSGRSDLCVTVQQRRWLVRVEERIVGRFRCRELGPDEEAAPPPTRAGRGTLDGPEFQM